MTGQEQRAAFLGTTYGTVRERFRLSPERGAAPSWAWGYWAVVTAWNAGGERAARGGEGPATDPR